jgi:hypothetical protein
MNPGQNTKPKNSNNNTSHNNNNNNHNINGSPHPHHPSPMSGFMGGMAPGVSTPMGPAVRAKSPVGLGSLSPGGNPPHHHGNHLSSGSQMPLGGPSAGICPPGGGSMSGPHPGHNQSGQLLGPPPAHVDSPNASNGTNHVMSV